LSPAARLIISFACGAILIAAGEYLRRTKIAASGYIPAGLASGGLVTAFGSIYAAHAIYDLLGPSITFIGLGGVALGALALARLQGPLIAAVGLVGSYLTPALVVSNQPQALGLFIYLLVILAACFALIRSRPWDWLGYLAILGTAGWGFLWVGSAVYEPSDAIVVGFFVFSFAAISAFGLLGLKVLSEEQGNLLDVTKMSLGLRLATLGAGLGVLALAYQVDQSHYDFVALLFLAVALAGIGLFGWLREGNSLAAPLAAGIGWVVLMMGHTYSTNGVWHYSDQSFLAWVLLATVFFTGLGAAGFWVKSQRMIWAGLLGAAPVLFLLGAFVHSPHVIADSWWALLGLALALGLLFIARLKEQDDVSTAVLLAAAAVLAVFGFSRLAEDLWFALLVAGLAIGYAAMSRIYMTAYVGRIATVLAGLAEIRLFLLHLDSSTHHLPWGQHWALYGYGLPAVGFWWASRILLGEKYTRSRIAFEGLSLGLLITLISLELHAFIAGDESVHGLGLLETGAHICSWLGAAYGLAYRQSLFSSRTSKWGAWVLLAMSATALILGCVVSFNPYFDRQAVEGGVVVNSLVLAYLAPSVLLLAISRKLEALDLRKFEYGFGAAGLVGALIYITLEVKRLFEGPVLSLQFVSDAESYALSAIWLVCALALLIIGLRLARPTLRYGGVAVLALTLFKTFGYDLWQLGGLWQVASVTGFGLSLVGIGWLYAKFLRVEGGQGSA